MLFSKMEENEAIFQTALRLYQDSKDREAVELLEGGSRKQSAEALLLLGEIYENPNTGSGIKRDVKKAIKYLESALSLSSGEAAYQLGQLYDFGDGVRPSSKKAISYWKEGWRLGDALSMLNLAKALIDERIELETAVEVLTSLLNDDTLSGTSCFYFSKIYLTENSKYYNFDLGLFYLEKGCSLRKVTCCMKLAELYWYGNRIEKDGQKALHFISQAKLCSNNLVENEVAQFEKIVRAGL